MRIGILRNEPGLSAYVGEILSAWGLSLWEQIEPGRVEGLEPRQLPLLICPAGCDPATEKRVGDFASRGGQVICFLPGPELARLAGIELVGPKETPARLRVTGLASPGLAGEMLPIVGVASDYRAHPAASAIGYLCYPDRYQGESIGISQAPAGRGTVTATAFDLPRCTLWLRQGDPANAERIVPGDVCMRASHLAAGIGAADSAWIPFADLLGRLLVELAIRRLPGPAPLIWHLPGEAPALLLFSGDEDHAPVEQTDAEMADLAGCGGRMSLYMIPNLTDAGPEAAARFSRGHDLGPHPNVRHLDGHPAAERLAAYEAQIRLFQERIAPAARTIRNHCLTWAGYTELAELEQRMGLRMDANFLCAASYARYRSYAPYAGFGAAMPMRFCRPDGRLIDILQQHTHIEDDVEFGSAEYSAKRTAEEYAPVAARVLEDAAGRFHTPVGANFHPANWARFSRQPGMALIREAQQRQVPIWSFDQWSGFCDARSNWRLERARVEGRRLALSASGGGQHEGLRLALPAACGLGQLREVRVNGRRVDWRPVRRHGRIVGLVSLDGGGEFAIHYQPTEA